MARDRRELGKILLEGKVQNGLQRLKEKKRKNYWVGELTAKTRKPQYQCAQMIKVLFLLAAIQTALSDTK